jgi:hypothetical protein
MCDKSRILTFSFVPKMLVHLGSARRVFVLASTQNDVIMVACVLSSRQRVELMVCADLPTPGITG